MDNQTLLTMAKEVSKRAYAPYSHFQVGAAILDEDGKVFTGCNVENATYGATCCAERNAIGKAVSEGAGKLLKIAVCTKNGQKATPCGICRQVLYEWMPQGKVIVEGKDGEIMVYSVKELLPEAFELEK